MRAINSKLTLYKEGFIPEKGCATWFSFKEGSFLRAAKKIHGPKIVDELLEINDDTVTWQGLWWIKRGLVRQVVTPSPRISSNRKEYQPQQEVVHWKVSPGQNTSRFFKIWANFWVKVRGIWCRGASHAQPWTQVTLNLIGYFKKTYLDVGLVFKPVTGCGEGRWHP